jgi:hypothetical protein
MLYKVTNLGEARTVTFLGVFAKGESREFNQSEMESFQAMSGVPIFASVLTDEDEFDVVVISDDTEKVS